MKEERFKRIMELLSDGEYASVEELSRLLFVSMPTIRRDLTAMQEMGLVVRSHGGVVQRRSDTFGTPAHFRMGVLPEVKMRLCAAAAPLLRDDCTIFLDESTTTLHMVEHISKFNNITVVTNNISALHLMRKYRIPSICLGGETNYETLSFYGRETEDMIGRFGIDLMFFSSSAVTSRGYIADYSSQASSLRRCALKQADTKIFICDSSKYFKNAAHILMPLRELDYIVTDTALPGELDTGAAKQIVSD